MRKRSRSSEHEFGRADRIVDTSEDKGRGLDRTEHLDELFFCVVLKKRPAVIDGFLSGVRLGVM